MSYVSIEGMSPQDYIQHLLDTEQWDVLLEIQQQIKYDDKYNKIKDFKPYPFQMKMFGAGVDHMARFACVGNRCG